MKKTLIAWALLLALLLPGAALGESTLADAERIAALEARVAALEAQVAALLAQGVGEYEQAPTAQSIALGEALPLADGLMLTATEWQAADRFRYYPSGGQVSSTLSAKPGYRLLCLFVTITNQTQQDVSVDTLLNATLYAGRDEGLRAQNAFYYSMGRGAYAGGLRSIGPDTQVSGCILFAMPESAENSGGSLRVQFVYGDQVYAYTLRDAALQLVPDESAAHTF
ncbi:MAG: DUF4352 domain-containing protein [Oscillospiraceae bacterium]|jgi:hypothetical protein|nr:DUF4352 domain-containing protein [Oscillospiraceae bacterium]